MSQRAKPDFPSPHIVRSQEVCTEPHTSLTFTDITFVTSSLFLQFPSVNYP